MEDRQLTLSKVVAKDSLLKIYRETTTETIVSWNDASVLRAKDMSIQEVQLLHLAEETADKVFDSGMSTAPTNTNVWDGQYKRITNLLDPQEDGDAMTLRYANDKQHGLITALKNEGATQDAGLKSTGDSQNTRLTNTGNTQNTRLTTTGDTQNKRLTDTGDSYVATMTTLKDTATTQATNASQSASNASASASTASTQATNAGKSASNASASATTASTKATEASNSANLSKAWAMSDSSPDGVSGNKSSKTWANEAKNSASNAATSASTATAKATEATTQATNAANSASAAAKSAENAKTFDPSSYYKKTETYTKSEVDNIKDNIIRNPLVGNDVLWNHLHRLGQNLAIPTTNVDINKLGVFISYYVNNIIANQPSQFGQLVNIPADNGTPESTQFWIEQSSGRLYHRGGDVNRTVNNIPFTRFLDTNDLNVVNGHLVINGSELWIE